MDGNRQPEMDLTASRARRRGEVAYFALLATAVVVCFLPLLRYFLAQDDFVLIDASWRNGLGEFFAFFKGEPGHFRPLTKALYFRIMYSIFGLNAPAYHGASIAFHILNVWLLQTLLRRLGIGRHAALTAATLFALSVAFFHVIAWASCIQQLMGQTFLLATLIFGIDAADSSRWRPRALSIVAYVLALMCVEQTFGAPLLLVLILRRRDTSASIRQAVRGVSPLVGIMAAYVAFMLLWKGRPAEGDYAFAYGKNVAINVMTYLGWVTSFGADLPTELSRNTIPVGPGHVAVVAILVYHLVRRRFRQVVFGLVYFFITISPTIFLVRHTFYLHTYIPAVGFAYLIALAADDLYRRWLHHDRAAWATFACTLVVMSVVSFVMVRRNESDMMHGDWEYRKSFVLRRAEVAERTRRTITDEIVDDSDADNVVMAYGRRGGGGQFNMRNVVAALGNGSAVRLFYGNPELKVHFTRIDSRIDPAFLERAHVYSFDDIGNCFRLVERPQE